jgi:hypothetical protein
LRLRFIPTSIHGVLDYLTSGVNISLPRVLGLDDASWAALVPRLVGATGASYSLLTDYQLGILKVIPMPLHLMLDAAKGVFYASSPWVFGFAKNGTRYWLPHVILGTADVLAAMTTKGDPRG